MVNLSDIIDTKDPVDTFHMVDMMAILCMVVFFNLVGRVDMMDLLETLHKCKA